MMVLCLRFIVQMEHVEYSSKGNDQKHHTGHLDGVHDELALGIVATEQVHVVRVEWIHF